MSVALVPTEGRWSLSRAESRLRGGLFYRCTRCGRFGDDFDVWQYWVGIVSTQCLCPDCVPKEVR